MAAMKIPKQPPAQRRGVDPPSSADASAPAGHSPPARVRDPVSTTSSQQHQQASQAGMLSIFPIPHMESDKKSPTKSGRKGKEPSFSYARRSDDAPVAAPSGRNNATRSISSTRSLSSHHRIDNERNALRSSFQKSNLGTKPKKTIRFDLVKIYDHDLEQPFHPDSYQKIALDDYEAKRGPRRSPKFFLKSEEELKSVRKMKEDQEKLAEKEWQQIRQDALSIQEEASVMGTQSVASVRSEASFANASFYEGFEDRFRIKKKKSKSLGSRFGRFFRRRSDNMRKTQSMIGDM